MNKLREKLALPFDGLRTETLDELEIVCKDISIAFSVFCAERRNDRTVFRVITAKKN